MDWVFNAADRKSEVDFDITREHPSLPSAAPSIAKRRARNLPIDGVRNLPGYLRQAEPGIQDCVQAGASVNNRGDVDYFAVRTDDTILVQEELPMLITLFPDGNLSNREFRLLRDVFEAGDEFADGDIAWIKIGGVVRPAK
jgi:hypothetical protein